jgi:SnoaL-like domain
LGSTSIDSANITPNGDRRSSDADSLLGLAERYVAAYNARDLEAMLILQDENVVSYPARLFGQRVLTGHSGVREWWQTMVDSGRWYDVVIRDMRRLDSDRVAVFGEIRDGGEPLSPWGVVVRVQNGVIVESRSYLSDEQLLLDIGALDHRTGAIG